MVRGRQRDSAEAEYLSPNFDATKLTKPQLRSILSAHGVTDLPPASARKEALLELFAHHITEKADEIARVRSKVRPSDKGIAFLDEKSRPSPRRPTPPSRSPAPSSPRRSSPSRSPSHRKGAASSVTASLDSSSVGRVTRRGDAASPSSPSSRSKTPTPRSRSRPATPAADSPIAMLQRTVPRYSDSPQSATIKLHDRLEFIASANRFTKAKHVISNTPPRHSQTAERASRDYLHTTLTWTGRVIIRLAEVFVPLFKALILGGFVMCLGFYIRWKYFYPFPYCDSGAPKASARRIGWRLMDLPELLNTFCINCPIYGVCKNGAMLCQEGFLPRRNWVLWGSDCVPDRRKMSLVDDLVGKMRFLLAERAGEVLCGNGIDRLESVLGEGQLAALLQQVYPLAEWNTVQFEALYKMALQELAKNPSLLGVEITKNPLDGSLILQSLSPRITIGCRIRVYLRRFYERNQVRIWLTGATLLLAGFWYLSYQRRSRTSKRVEELCQAVLQILAEQDALNRRDPTIPSAISIHQIRDALFFKANNRTRNRLWPLVCKAIGRNANVRETVMSIKGEEHRVWEWIGSDVLSPYLNLVF